MFVKEIVDENFQDYKKPSMFIGIGNCDWKCCREQNLPISICQNSEWGQKIDIQIDNQNIIQRYLNNPITSAIVIGGLEPLTHQKEVIDFLKELRQISQDEVVIYTGYYKKEIQYFLDSLRKNKLTNIIMKFGRFVFDDTPRYDDVLGITLASSNQYAEKVL